jgi:hypothetical protein
LNQLEKEMIAEKPLMTLAAQPAERPVDEKLDQKELLQIEMDRPPRRRGVRGGLGM